jgi:hypothetical protein
MKDSIAYIILSKIHCLITMKISIQSEKNGLTQKEWIKFAISHDIKDKDAKIPKLKFWLYEITMNIVF